MFEKRKPIYAGVTYIFDALNESNMAASTSVVTTIKKSKKKKHWIVLSVNNGDVFECHENLLTEFVNYDTVNPIIRCQYGTTEFNMADVAFLDMITDGFDMMSEAIDDEKFGELNNKIKNYVSELRDKIKKYAEISDYKYKIAAITNIKQAVEKYCSNHSFSDILEKAKEMQSDAIESEITGDEVTKLKETINESGFYDKFDRAVKEYMFSSESIEDFMDKALDLLEEDFPKEAMIPEEKKYKYITPGDIESLKRASAKALHSNNMIFLVGVTSSGQQIAVGVFDISDFDEVDKFIYTCYDKWEDKKANYYSDYRITLLSVPIRPPFMNFGDDDEEDYDE